MTGSPSSGEVVVDVIIVNYNTVGELRSCLTAVLAADRIGAVHVVDNGSADGSLEMVRSDFPTVRPISLEHNPGYGAAVNAAMALCTTDVVVVLNADARIRVDTAGSLADLLVARPDVAILGPQLTDGTGERQVSSYREPSVLGVIEQETGLHRFRRPGRLSPSPAPDGDGDHEQSVVPVDWVLGAVLAVRRAAFDAVGGFDPRFFLYLEEVDLCHRLRCAGWLTGFAGTVEAVHDGGASTRQMRVAAQRQYFRSLDRYFRFHRPDRVGALRFTIVSIAIARLVRELPRALLGPRAARSRASESSQVWRAVATDTVRTRHDDDRASTPSSFAASRSDWLMLLPDPPVERPTVLVSANTGGSERLALRDHFDAVRVVVDAADDPVDVVVTEAGRGLGDVLDVLAPGGVAYVRRRHSRWNVVRRTSRLDAAIASAGCSVSGRYWVLPNVVDPRVHVPLADAAVRWYLTEMYAPTGPVSRLGRALALRWPSLAPRLGGDQSLVLTKGPPALPGVLDTLCRRGLDARPDDLIAVATSGLDVGSRSVLMLFTASGHRRPIVVKVSAVGRLDETTRIEQTTLARVRDRLPPSRLGSVPEPLDLFEWRRRAVGVETAMIGRRLDVALRRERRPAYRLLMLRDVAEWLTDVQIATAEPIPWTERVVADEVAAPIRRFREVFDPAPAVDQLFDRTLAAASELIGSSIPLVRRHFDLGPWNIVVTSAGTGVIDWETFAGRVEHTTGLPLGDLHYFVKFWLHIDRRAESIEEEFRQFDFIGPDNSRFAACRTVVRQYCERLAIDPRFAPILIVLAWVEHALNDVARDQALGLSTGTSSRAAEIVGALAPGDWFSGCVLGYAADPPVREVGIVSPVAIGDTTGHGAPAAIRGKVTALARDHRVTVASSVEPDDASSTRISNVVEYRRRRRALSTRRLRLLIGLLAGRAPWSTEWEVDAFASLATPIAERSDVTHVEFVVMVDAIQRRGPGPIIVTDHDPPIDGALVQLRRDPPWLWGFRCLEVAAWWRTYRRAASIADLFVVFDADDRRRIERLTAGTPVVVAPFPIVMPTTELDSQGWGDPTIAFVGSFRHQPNVDALHDLVMRLMPAIWRRRPEVRLLLVGSSPPPFVVDIDPRIVVTGFVDDVPATIAPASVVIAPVRTGGGMRVKVIEAMSLGKAVVATTRGAAGLPPEARACLRLADDDDGLVAAVLELIDDPADRRRRASAGRAWAASWLAPDRVAARTADLHRLALVLAADRRRPAT